jgi:hypothetical protein
MIKKDRSNLPYIRRSIIVTPVDHSNIPTKSE